MTDLSEREIAILAVVIVVGVCFSPVVLGIVTVMGNIFQEGSGGTGFVRDI